MVGYHRETHHFREEKSPKEFTVPQHTRFILPLTSPDKIIAALRKRELVGARPLHLANARPFGRLKAPLGLSLLRCAAQTRACLWQAEQAHHANNEKQEVPVGELPVVHIAIVCGFFRVRPIQGRTLFFAMLHHFPRAASGIRHQHGSGSDAAHPGIVPVFCAGMPYKHARRQCHFPAYCPILSA